VSAVAHGLESRGVATVVLAGVLPQVEKTRPPRALMTPFQLGRPLGEPGDAGYQLRVLLQALRLLERPDGPVILDHFDEDPPGWFDRPGWRPALAVPAWGALNGAADWAAALQAELGPVMTAWQGSKHATGAARSVWPGSLRRTGRRSRRHSWKALVRPCRCTRLRRWPCASWPTT
jgi:hypothetical protein